MRPETGGWTPQASSLKPQTYLILWLAVLAACAEVPRRPPTDTAFPVPERWSVHRDLPPTAALERWLATFKDPALSALVQEAISRNYDLRATAARVEAARAQALIEGAPRKPQLDFSPGIQRSREVFDGAGESAFYQTRWTLPFNLSWEIDLWGRIRAAREAAEAELADSYRSTLSAESEHLAVRRELLTNRIGLYLALGGGF